MRGKRFKRFKLPKLLRITPACAGKTIVILHAEGAGKDHPRVCGENALLSNAGVSAGGSPPRVRGKQAVKLRDIGHARITPACAGKTARQNGSRGRRQDHPRVCGENYGMNGVYWCAEGSPPRVRGKRLRRGARERDARITPACAGKTACTLERRRETQDHPRVCGENCSLSSHQSDTMGSPPRVRGKRQTVPRSSLDNRITPACAGKTAV